MGVTDFGDMISSIQALAMARGLVEFQRQFKRVDGELVPTGNCRWNILNQNGIKGALVKATSRERAIAIGQQVAATDEALKFHRLIEVMEPAELMALEEILQDGNSTSTPPPTNPAAS